MTTSGLQNFIGAANTALNRAFQFTGEALGKSSKTSYDDELIVLFERADKLKLICDKLQSGIGAWLNPNPADRVQEMVLEKFDASKKTAKLTTSELLGQMKQNLAQEIPGTDLSLILSQYGLADVEIGQAERILQDEIQKNLLANAKNFIENVWPNVATHRRNLEFVRLDYDSVVQKRAKSTDMNKQRTLDDEIRIKKNKLDQEITTVRSMLKQITSTQDILKEGLREMATAQMRYYTAALEQIRQLGEKLEQH